MMKILNLITCRTFIKVLHFYFIYLERIISNFLDLKYYGVLMLAQKAASQFGDGEGAVAFWKNSMSDYHDESKVKNIPK